VFSIDQFVADIKFVFVFSSLKIKAFYIIRYNILCQV